MSSYSMFLFVFLFFVACFIISVLRALLSVIVMNEHDVLSEVIV